MKYPLLVIFDMDGLMFDTETDAYRAWQLTAKKFDFHIDTTLLNQFIGRRNEEILEGLIEFYGEESQTVEWRTYMKQVKLQLVEKHMQEESFKKKGLDSILKYLKKNNTPIAIASSSSSNVINRYLKVTHLDSYIDYIVSGNEVDKGKPDPEIFIKACEKAKVPLEASLVLEDSLAGIKAAHNDSIPCYFIPDRQEVTDEIIQLSTKIFDNLLMVEKYLTSLKREN